MRHLVHQAQRQCLAPIYLRLQPVDVGAGEASASIGDPFWALVQLGWHSGEVLGGVLAWVCALGEVLVEEAVGVLVGFALPERVRVAEVDVGSGYGGALDVVGHLLALVPGQRASQVLRDVIHRGPRPGWRWRYGLGQAHQDGIAGGPQPAFRSRSGSVPR